MERKDEPARRSSYRAEIVALLLSLAGVLAAHLVGVRVFEALPHVEDEMAYVWQARVLAHGQLTAPTPPDPQSMQVPFVVDAHGARFAKYPPGWPMVLALGLLLGIRAWVNPILGGLAVWLTFRLGQKVFSDGIGLLAALLTLTSPFFLINSGSLDSHPWSLVLSLAFCLAWLDTFDLVPRSATRGARLAPRWLTALLAGLSLGMLALTRPLTALGVALPFFISGLVLLWRGNAGLRIYVLLVGFLTLLVGSFFFVWQFAVTGNPLTDPYTLWWSFDRIGFGPGVGTDPGGHTLLTSLIDARLMLSAAARDLFGWGRFSWLFLPFGLWAIRRNRPAWLVAGVFPGLVLVYMAYWAEVVRYGPRYYYEGLYSVTLLSAAGLFWLADRLQARLGRTLSLALVALLITGLISYNLSSYLPARLDKIYGLYGIHRAQLQPFQTPAAQAYAPALVFVHQQNSWTDYAGLLELEDPWLTSPFIFARSLGPAADARTAANYPGRTIIDYFPGAPDPFRLAPP